MKNLTKQFVLAMVVVLLVAGMAVSATSKTSKMMPGTMTLAVEPNTEPNKPAEPNKPEEKLVRLGEEPNQEPNMPAEPNKPEQKLVKLAEEPNAEPNKPAEPNVPVKPKKRPKPSV